MALGCVAEQEAATGRYESQFRFPAIGNFACQQSGILKGAKERKSEWGSWWNQPGVAPYLDGHVNRQLWKWNGPNQNISRTEKVATVLLMDEGVRQSLDWKTYFRRDPDTFQEPDALTKKGGPPPPPLTQDQMQAMCDMNRLVKPTDYGSGTREHREYRAMKGLARRRIFTQALVEAAGVQMFFLLQKLFVFVLFTAIAMNSHILLLLLLLLFQWLCFWRAGLLMYIFLCLSFVQCNAKDRQP